MFSISNSDAILMNSFTQCLFFLCRWWAENDNFKLVHHSHWVRADDGRVSSYNVQMIIVLIFTKIFNFDRFVTNRNVKFVVLRINLSYDDRYPSNKLIIDCLEIRSFFILKIIVSHVTWNRSKTDSVFYGLKMYAYRFIQLLMVLQFLS